MAKICLIRPPRLMRLISTSMNSAYAVGLAFISATLREKGHDVSVIDAIAEAPKQTNFFKEDIVTLGLSKEEIVARIPRDVDIIGFSCMFSQDWLGMRELIDFVGDAFPAVHIIAGGEHITSLPEFSMKKTRHLKACVVGEGEETIVQLVDALMTGRSLHGIEGVAFKEGDNIYINRRRNRVRDLDSLPYPAWDLLPMQSYFDNKIIFGVDRGRCLVILATRGCPYTCTFCSCPDMWGKRYYMRDVSKVVDEIVHFKNIYDIENVDFYDLTAIISKDWIISFCKELMARKVNVTWQLPSGTRTEAIDAEVAEYMAKSGCKNMTYAPESGSEELLVKIKKKVSLESMFSSMKVALKQGLNIKMNIIIGLPEETHRDAWKTLWFILKASWHGANDVGSTAFTAYPGSAIFNDLVRANKINVDDDEYFISLMDSHNLFNIRFYNDYVSKSWLIFYRIAALLTFYGTTFIFRPWRLYTFLRNIFTTRYESRGEMALGELLRRFKLMPKRKPDYASSVLVAK